MTAVLQGYSDAMNARHIIQIREALWKRPELGACVMVGAGFSRQTALRRNRLLPAIAHA